jgi:hypothetical protein
VTEVNDDAQDRRTTAPDEARAVKQKETHIHPAAITELENAKTGIRGVDEMSENGTEIEVTVVAGIMTNGRRDENEAIVAISLRTDLAAESVRDEIEENNDDEVQLLLKRGSQLLI